MTLYLEEFTAEVMARNKAPRSKFDLISSQQGSLNRARQAHASNSHGNHSALYFLIRLLSQNSIFIHTDPASESPLKGPSSCQAILSAGAAGPLHCKQAAQAPE